MGAHPSGSARRDNIQQLLDMLVTQARNEIAYNDPGQPRATVIGQAIEAAAASGDPSRLVALLDAYVMEAKSTRDQALAARERARAERAAVAARQGALATLQEPGRKGGVVVTDAVDDHIQLSREYVRRIEPSRRGKPRRAAPRRDMPGLALRPDPLAARDAAGLLEILRAYWKWANQPSYRDMAARYEGRVGVTTMWRALNQDKLPDPWLVDAIVAGCGGSDEDRDAFAAACRIIGDGGCPAESERPSGEPDAGRAALRSLPPPVGPPRYGARETGLTG